MWKTTRLQCLSNKDSDDKDRIWIRSPAAQGSCVRKGNGLVTKQGSGIHDLNNGKYDL